MEKRRKEVDKDVHFMVREMRRGMFTYNYPGRNPVAGYFRVIEEYLYFGMTTELFREEEREKKRHF